jgi:hypothetical protein
MDLNRTKRQRGLDVLCEAGSIIEPCSPVGADDRSIEHRA